MLTTGMSALSARSIRKPRPWPSRSRLPKRLMIMSSAPSFERLGDPGGRVLEPPEVEPAAARGGFEILPAIIFHHLDGYRPTDWSRRLGPPVPCRRRESPAPARYRREVAQHRVGDLMFVIDQGGEITSASNIDRSHHREKRDRGSGLGAASAASSCPWDARGQSASTSSVAGLRTADGWRPLPTFRRSEPFGPRYISRYITDSRHAEPQRQHLRARNRHGASLPRSANRFPG